MPAGPQVHLRRESRDGGAVVYLVLDDEARLNALGSELMQRFKDALETLKGDETLRCLVVTGAGERAFVAGADVDELAAITSPDEARAFIGKVHDCCEAVRAFPVPVIAAINGVALGAGLELAISCDLRVAAETARFGMPEVKLGIPSVVEAALLPGLIGWGRAREMLLLGESIDAEAARAMGLVDACVPAADLSAAVEKRIAALFSSRPEATRLQKVLMRQWENLPAREAIAAGVDVFAQAYLTDEPSLAMKAWREQRARRSDGV